MKKGFTLVELILVIAIIALVSAFTLPLFTSIQEKSSTIVARQHVVSTLRLAKVYAHTMKYDTDWGVHMADTNMTLFRGNDYALRDASYDEIIILDEPTKGIDVRSKSAVHEFMGELVDSGMSIIMISSELPEILGMCDRVVVMYKGLIKNILDVSKTSSEEIVGLASGE